MRIKKSHIRAILLTLLSFNEKTGQPYSGLLLENLGLGVKRKLQKIRNELLAHEAELKADESEIVKIEDEEQRNKEAEELYNEEITLLSEPAMISEIEKIQTDKNYDFELIEMIAK
jgi:hypothetical protein